MMPFEVLPFGWLLGQYGLLFLFILIALTDAGLPIPIPYDIAILLTGYRNLPLWQVLAAAVGGSLAGDSALYFLARKFGYRLLEKYEKFLFLNHATHKKMERWLLKYGPLVILVARLVPGLRFAGSFACGLARLPYKKIFVPYMILAASLWAVSYYYLGKAIGEGITAIAKFNLHFRTFSFLPIMLILSITLVVALRIISQKRRAGKVNF